MNSCLKAVFAAALSAFAASGLAAQDWTPPGPIQLMIGFAAGGGADSQARLIAEELQNVHGWEIIPENVTGRGGLNLAAEMRGGATDGTLIGLVVTETLGYNLAAAPDAGMQTSDFTGLTTTAGFQMGIVSRTDRGWASFEDMIAAAEGGEQVRFGVMSSRLADLAYLLSIAQDVNFNIVEVRGGRAVMDGVNAGDLDVGFMAGIQRNGVASGDLVNLASAMDEALVQTPDAPTLPSLGVPFTGGGHFVFVAPAGIDAAARDALTSAIVEIVSDPDTEAGALIARAFGGPSIISGDALDEHLQASFDDAGELLTAVSE
ncbi:MAG: tripartite tricarboxylate transporter substrate-binding protein [Pseudomonadota bacterium]